MTITCQYEVWGPDMHPEFAPEPICYAKCERPATHRVISVWGNEDIVCAEHSTEADAAETTVVPLTPEYTRGWLHGQSEATAVVLTPHEVSWLCHEDHLPERLEPRSPVSGEWAAESLAELGLADDDAIEAYGDGYENGWTRHLFFTAAELYDRAGQP